MDERAAFEAWWASGDRAAVAHRLSNYGEGWAWGVWQARAALAAAPATERAEADAIAQEFLAHGEAMTRGGKLVPRAEWRADFVPAAPAQAEQQAESGPFGKEVLVAITRPVGYEDVCDELVLEDACINAEFKCRLVKHGSTMTTTQTNVAAAGATETDSAVSGVTMEPESKERP